MIRSLILFSIVVTVACYSLDDQQSLGLPIIESKSLLNSLVDSDKSQYISWLGEASHEDPLSQVASFIDLQYKDELNSESGDISFLETNANKVHGWCEICILIMQMKERGQPHLCAGLNADYFITCIENLESLLRADKAITYWLRSGCMHLDREGAEIAKPCPAHAICAWVPNLFDDSGILTPRNELASLCPKDNNFLPRIPRQPAPQAASS